ncbi:DUF3313 domain-containing protein [Novosphingobium sp. G106]|uniref:DUF3313 domain-containing protein n=1 Tax=Novosphingobium sp. G106 TaxID=2849500 RepID=UPI001C2D01D6|nr:DUF3313 domain-containing protein [Novosphingobium sp. G106]MBV1691549.1 DUF3313 domain-containing protein [Novosphingobium sp. G106]
MLRAINLILLAACLAGGRAAAQTQDNAPQALASAQQLEHDKKESWTYIKPDLHLARYTALQIQPTVVYRGTDAQFEDIPQPDRVKFAQLMTDALREELARSFRLVQAPAANTMRLRMTLVGARKTTGGVGTVSSVMPLGLVTNVVKSATGKKGTFSGSVLFAIEIFDSRSGELLAAVVRREAPDALDIKATVSTTDTVKAVAGNIAKKLRERLVEAKADNP